MESPVSEREMPARRSLGFVSIGWKFGVEGDIPSLLMLEDSPIFNAASCEGKRNILPRTHSLVNLLIETCSRRRRHVEKRSWTVSFGVDLRQIFDNTEPSKKERLVGEQTYIYTSKPKSLTLPYPEHGETDMSYGYVIVSRLSPFTVFRILMARVTSTTHPNNRLSASRPIRPGMPSTGK